MPIKVKYDPILEMKTTIRKAVAEGPQFLAEKIPAEKMAQNMIDAVDEFYGKARKKGGLPDGGQETQALLNVLLELKGCGSGFLAQRCDSACVARTVTSVMNEFSE